MDKHLIIIFMKACIKGFVKTRLAKDVGDDKALLIYESMCRRVINESLKTGKEVHIYYYPENKKNQIIPFIKNDIKLFPQKGSSLGEKMKNAFLDSFKSGYKKVILVGSDIPEISCRIINIGFENIKNNPVIGPGFDGGYYLIGFDDNCFDDFVFDNILWSTNTVFDATMEKFCQKKLSPVKLKMLNDIDTKEDLDFFIAKGTIDF